MHVDQVRSDGFGLTISATPWRAGLPVHLELRAPAAYVSIFHGTFFAAHSHALSAILGNRAGLSSSGHAGMQLNFRGKWKGADVSCSSHCISAAVKEAGDRPSAKGNVGSGSPQVFLLVPPVRRPSSTSPEVPTPPVPIMSFMWQATS